MHESFECARDVQIIRTFDVLWMTLDCHVLVEHTIDVNWTSLNVLDIWFFVVHPMDIGGSLGIVSYEGSRVCRRCARTPMRPLTGRLARPGTAPPCSTPVQTQARALREPARTLWRLACRHVLSLPRTGVPGRNRRDFCASGTMLRVGHYLQIQQWALESIKRKSAKALHRL